MKIKLISYILLFLSVVWLVKIIYESSLSLNYNQIQLKSGYLLISFICILFFLLLNSLNYHFLSRFYKIETSFRQNSLVYLKSYLSLYLPGKIGLLLARIMNHNKNDKKIEITGIYFIESIIGMLSSVFVAVGVIIDFYSWYYFTFIVIGMLLILHPKILIIFTKILRKIVKSSDSNYIEHKHSYFLFCIIFTINSVKWLLFGLGLNLVIIGIADIHIDPIYIVSGYSASSILAMFAVFSPSGIGVMEVSLSYIYALKMPMEFAVLFSIVFRIWKIVSELILVPILIYLIKNYNFLDYKETKV